MNKLMRFIHLFITPFIIFCLIFCGAAIGKYDYNKSLIINCSKALHSSKDRFVTEIKNEKKQLDNWAWMNVYNFDFYYQRFSVGFRVSVDEITLTNENETLSIDAQISGIKQTRHSRNESQNDVGLKTSISMESFTEDSLIINKEISLALNVLIGDSINIKIMDGTSYKFNVMDIYESDVYSENEPQNIYNNSLYAELFNNLVFVPESTFNSIAGNNFKGYVTFGKDLKMVEAAYNEIKPFLEFNQAWFSIPKCDFNNYEVEGIPLWDYHLILKGIVNNNDYKVTGSVFIILAIVIFIVSTMLLDKMMVTYIDFSTRGKHKYFLLLMYMFYCIGAGATILLIFTSKLSPVLINGSLIYRNLKLPLQLLSVCTIIYIVLVGIMYMSNKKILEIKRKYENGALKINDLVESEALQFTANEPVLKEIDFEEIDNSRDSILAFGTIVSPCQSAGACRCLYYGKLFAKANYNFFLSTFMEDVKAFSTHQYSDNIFFIPFSQKPKTIKEKIKHTLLNARRIKHVLSKFKHSKLKAILIYSVMPVASVLAIKKFCKKNNIKLIFDVVESQVLSQQSFSSFFTYYLRQRLINNVLINKYTSVITISSYLHNYYTNKKIKSILIPFISDTKTTNDCTSIKNDLKKRKNAKYILYAGNPFNKRDLLAPIFSAINNLEAKEKEKVVFIIAGVGIEQLLTREGVKDVDLLSTKDNIAVIGRVNHYLIENLYSLCDYTILVKPLNTRFSKAGFPTKVSESLAHGVPPIANISSDLETYLSSENSIIIDGDEEVQIRTALSKAINVSKEKQNEMRKNARSTSFKYLDINTYYEEMMSFINE